MTLTNLAKAPFPWFGGKSKAAELVWQLLGDPPHYVEPFAGSLAVLLNRPHPCNRPYVSESVNDLDGFVVNAWRAMQWHPEETARHASWPVTEADKTARQIACLRWQTDHDLEHLMGDPLWCDPLIAGWWLWAVAAQIGAFAGDGPWTADPTTGRITKQARPGAREPGVRRSRPHISNGRGVNHAGAREPGVSPLEDIGDGDGFHPVTMPELVRWFQFLSARLRHVRILNGDWHRLCTTGAMHTIQVRMGDGPVGVFLDPPYADTSGRAAGIYTEDSFTVAHDVREWCLTNGDNPKNRIVLAGFDGEHGTALTDAGWTEHEWFTAGYLTGGMGNVNTSGGSHQQHRERLWSSPHCITPNVADEQLGLFQPTEGATTT